MEAPISTPKAPAPTFRQKANLNTKTEPLFSSSPGFATPAYPIATRPAKPAPAFPLQTSKTNNAQTVLPIVLPPQTLRPVAFRTLTKKHNLTLTSASLTLLAQFIGKHCGSGWREDGLAERVLDELAKQWKQDNGGVILEDGADKRLRTLLKSFESCMLGGRIEMGKFSRSNSLSGTLSRTSSDLRLGMSREDSLNSLGLANLEVEDGLDIDEERLSKQDSRSYLKVISAFHQPRLVYSPSKNTLETLGGTASLLPPIHHKITMLKSRYHIVHQRLMRNESFQTPSFSTTFAPPKLYHSGSNAISRQQSYKITPVSNLLGRSGSSRLLLGLLVHTAAGDLALTDLTSSVVLDMSIVRPIPEDGVWFCPGMVVLIEGTYEEDGSNNSNLGTAGGVGGQIKGRFIAETIAGPPAERREVTLGTTHDLKIEKTPSAGAGFGWIDFLGVGSEKAVGTRMRRIQRHILSQVQAEDEDEDEVVRPRRTKLVVIGECHLDSPRTLDAIRAILSSYTISPDISTKPLSIVLMGNFVSAASMAGSTKGGGSIEYKEHFDQLASLLSEFPALLANTSLVFVPGNNDPWASAFAAGAAPLLPQPGIPELFTSRVRRVINNANAEVSRKEGDAVGEAIWASNPARMSLFGPVEDIVLFRDNMTGRFRRNAVMFSRPPQDAGDQLEPSTPAAKDAMPVDLEDRSMELDASVRVATSHLPLVTEKLTTSPSTATARRLVKTILDQGHLAPFPVSIRPVSWDFASALTLYPLPTAMVLADSEAPAFAITYEGCHVMNPGRVLDELGTRIGMARWVEYDIRTKRGAVRDVRF